MEFVSIRVAQLLSNEIFSRVHFYRPTNLKTNLPTNNPASEEAFAFRFVLAHFPSCWQSLEGATTAPEA